jgi:hypothetical protein
MKRSGIQDAGWRGSPDFIRATTTEQKESARMVPQGPWYGAVGVNPRHGGDGKGLGNGEGLSAVGLRPRLYALAPLGPEHG